MNEQRFETGKSPQVVINKCGGALVIGGWKGTAVLAKGSEFKAETPDLDQIVFNSNDDLTLTVPEKASLAIDNVDQSLTIKHVDGRLDIGTIGGNLTLNDVVDVKIKSVGGKLHGENINGSTTLIEAKQTVTLRNVADVGINQASHSVSISFAKGAVLLDQVQGDVSLHTISGDIIIRQAGQATLNNLGGKNEVGSIKGELQLIGGLVNGEHHFHADGDIYVGWPPDGPVTLVAKAAFIDNQLPLSNETKTAEKGVTTLTGHIENGKSYVHLNTPANIGLKSLSTGDSLTLSAADFDFTPPPPSLQEIVTTAVREHLPETETAKIDQIAAVIGEQLVEFGLAASSSSATAVAPFQPSRGKAAAKKAQRKFEKSIEKAKQSMAQAQTRLETPPPEPGNINDQRQTISPDTTETAVQPSQTQILQLLKDDLISVEQANLLLDNLRDG